MRRRSPPTDRVIGLLEVLAARPGEALTSAEIARRVNITRTTCHSLLMTLADAGYLVRDPRAKTYVLGPALIGIGNAAQRSFPSIQMSRGELERLHRRTGMACTVTTIVDGDIVVIEQLGSTGGAPPRPSQGIPLTAPFGALHVAWSGPEVVAAWLDGTGRGPTADVEAEYERLLASLRSQRYSVSPLDEAGVRLRAMLDDLAGEALSDDIKGMALALASVLRSRDYLPEELAPGKTVDVDTVAAPVFDAVARPDFTVAVHARRPDMPTEEVAALASDLLEASRRMTRLVGGGEPASEVVEGLARSGPGH